MMPIGDDNSGRRSTPVVTYALIALNILVFLLELTLGDAFIVEWSFVPARFVQNPILESTTIFSAMFMHAGLVHLGGNLLYLWIFGDNVEDNFGHFKFLVFYILSGIGATFLQFIFNPDSNIPNLGASGAIAGVLGAYLIMFPGRRINVLVGRFITQMNALIVIGFWFVLQLFSGLGSLDPSAADVGGVAYMAHIGGFIAGFVLSFIFRDSSRLRQLPPPR
ncbi:MAG: rhomboid family intramembrane serine protease [Anaerolineales bacterium]|nr:MAG: rhomboid family intramembrane serine protease [Anaerolineales bacterium]